MRHLLSCVAKLSWSSVYRLSNLLSWALFGVFSYRKKIVRTNLRRSFPELTEEKIQRVAQTFFRHFTDIFLETVKLQYATQEEIATRMQGNLSLLDDCYAKGQSTVLVLGHRGNWEMANLYASIRFQQECIVVYKPLSNPAFEEWFCQLRTRFGSRVVPMRSIYTELRKPRQRPYILFLLNDQSAPPKSAYWTTFLNQETGVLKGAEVLARTFQLPVIYADLARDPEKRGFYQMKLELVTDSPDDTPENGILEDCTQRLQRDIRNEPANWLWTHKRWKHKRPEKRVKAHRPASK